MHTSFLGLIYYNPNFLDSEFWRGFSNQNGLFSQWWSPCPLLSPIFQYYVLAHCDIELRHIPWAPLFLGCLYLLGVRNLSHPSYLGCSREEKFKLDYLYHFVCDFNKTLVYSLFTGLVLWVVILIQYCFCSSFKCSIMIFSECRTFSYSHDWWNIKKSKFS